MSDRQLALEILLQILSAAAKIKRRFEGISAPDDFISSDDGIGLIDSMVYA